MRITRIFVEKLFGVFDHEIRLNLDDRITIIHSPNGYGKTIILKMLDGLFNVRYSELRKTPYKSFQIEFDNGESIEVQKGSPQKWDRMIPLTFILHSKDGDQVESFTSEDIQESTGDYWSTFQKYTPGLGRSTGENGGNWLYLPTDERLDTSEVIERFGDQVSARRESSSSKAEWLLRIREQVSTYLIESQRLLSFENNESVRNYRVRVIKTTPLPTVVAYSEELVLTIKKSLDEHASISQVLERSLPARMIKRVSSNELTNDELRNKLAELEKSRKRLMELGLLEKDEKEDSSIQLQDIDASTRNFLAVYIEDVEKKLAIFSDISKKLDLFRRIINSKFSYKEIFIDRKKGFILKSKYPEGIENDASEFLSPSALSSGEQHELVLIYELLFKVKEKSLVLIDEPELSLHLGWQVKFLEDLQEISELVDLDFLIATHAPSLIHDRWDLTVELKGVAP